MCKSADVVTEVRSCLSAGSGDHIYRMLKMKRSVNSVLQLSNALKIPFYPKESFLCHCRSFYLQLFEATWLEYLFLSAQGRVFSLVPLLTLLFLFLKVF